MLPEILGFEHVSPLEIKGIQASTPIHAFQIPVKIVVKLGAQNSNIRDYNPDFRSALAGSLASGGKNNPQC